MHKLIAILALCLTGCAGRKPVTVAIPTCSAELVVPKGCVARPWGNGVEVDCPGEAKPKIYLCNTLEHPSPGGKP